MDVLVALVYERGSGLRAVAVQPGYNAKDGSRCGPVVAGNKSKRSLEMKHINKRIVAMAHIYRALNNPNTERRCLFIAVRSALFSCNREICVRCILDERIT